MPPRRSSGRRHRRKRTRVKVVPYVVPTTRRAPGRPMPLTVPTRWVKNIIAFFLLPWCAILTQTFFTAFTRATIHQQLWAGAEFWFFYPRRGALVDRVPRVASTSHHLRFRSRADPRALGLVNGRTSEQISGQR